MGACCLADMTGLGVGRSSRIDVTFMGTGTPMPSDLGFTWGTHRNGGIRVGAGLLFKLPGRCELCPSVAVGERNGGRACAHGPRLTKRTIQ